MAKQKRKRNTSKRQKEGAISARIRRSIGNAEAITNPLKELEAYLSFDVGRNEKNDGLLPQATDSTQQISFSIDFFPSPLPKFLLDQCMTLFERNMSDMYRSSSWGLDLSLKKQELTHEKARFLIVRRKQEDGSSGTLAGFCHFRFDVNDDEIPTEEVLYVFEIQVEGSFRRCGIGKRLMNLMELLAMRTHMQKVMLTVFKSNIFAMNFYLKTMHYSIDASSPSNFKEGDDADYEILSKQIW